MEALTLLIILFLLWLTCGFVSSSVANAKGWSKTGWFLAGLLLGPVGLLGSIGMPDRVLRKYIRQIAARQEAFGDEFVEGSFQAASSSNDDIWKGILKCFRPAIAATLSQGKSDIWHNIVLIRDVEGFDVGQARLKNDSQKERTEWIVSLTHRI